MADVVDDDRIVCSQRGPWEVLQIGNDHLDISQASKRLHRVAGVEIAQGKGSQGGLLGVFPCDFADEAESASRQDQQIMQQVVEQKVRVVGGNETRLRLADGIQQGVAECQLIGLALQLARVVFPGNVGRR